MVSKFISAVAAAEAAAPMMLLVLVVCLALYLATTICHILNTTTTRRRRRTRGRGAAMIATTRRAMQSIAPRQSNKRQGNNASQHKFYLFYKRTLPEHLTRCPGTHTHTHTQSKRYLHPPPLKQLSQATNSQFDGRQQCCLMRRSHLAAPMGF